MKSFSSQFIGARPSGWSFIFATGLSVNNIARHVDTFDTVAKFHGDDGTNDYYQIAAHDKNAITEWARQSDIGLLVDCDGEPSGSVTFQPVAECFDLTGLDRNE